jgi:hypothetical protein
VLLRAAAATITAAITARAGLAAVAVINVAVVVVAPVAKAPPPVEDAALWASKRRAQSVTHGSQRAVSAA